MVIVVLLTLTFVNNENAVNYFSFAGTLSSIILSVVAIFMTINSENESKDAKTQLDRSIVKMEESTSAVKKPLTTGKILSSIYKKDWTR